LRSSCRNGVAFTGGKKEIRFQPVLPRVEIVVTSAERKKLGMVSTLDDPSLLYNQDLVSSTDR